MSKRTPGSWTLHPRVTEDPPIIYSSQGCLIATVNTSDRPTREDIKRYASMAVHNARHWGISSIVPVRGRNWTVRPSSDHLSGWTFAPYFTETAKRKPLLSRLIRRFLG